MSKQDIRQPWVARVRLLAADASRTIYNGATLGNALIAVIYIEVVITTAAAQLITIRSTNSDVVYGVIPASAPVGSMYKFGPYIPGLLHPAALNGLVAVPAAAGPAAEIYAEGYVEGYAI